MGKGKTTVTPEELERICRRYHSNGDAAAALQMTSAGFRRLCSRLGVASPRERQERKRSASRRHGDA